MALECVKVTTDDLTYPGNAAYRLTGNLTLSAWVRADTLSAGSGGFDNQIFVVGANGETAADNVLMGLAVDDSQTDPRIICLTESGTGTDATAVSDQMVWFTLGEWHHILVTRTDAGGSTHDYDFYVDGIAVGTANVAHPASGGSSQMYIGNLYDSGTATHHWDGKIEQLAMWNSALVAGDRALLAAGTPPDSSKLAVAASGRVIYCPLIGTLDEQEVPLTGTATGGFVLDDDINPPFETHRWKLDEASASSLFVDETGDTDLTVTGTPVFEQPCRATRITQATEFDGSTEYGVTGSGFVSPGAITVAAFIYLETADGQQPIIAKWHATGNERSFTMRIGDNGTQDNSLVFNVSDDGTGFQTWIAVSGPGRRIPLKTWTHVAAAYDPSDGQVTLWVNGEDVTPGTTPTVTGELHDAAIELRIGSEQTFGGSARFFHGRIADVRMVPAVVTAAVVADWAKFDLTKINEYLLDEASGNFADNVGSETLTASGGLTYEQTALARAGVGKAVDFDGVDAKGETTTGYDIPFGNWAISGVAKIVNTGLNSPIISKWDRISLRSLVLYAINDRIRFGYSTTGGNQYVRQSPTSSVSDATTFEFLCQLYNGEPEIWIDKVKQSLTTAFGSLITIPLPPFVSIEEMSIGHTIDIGDPGNGAKFLDGELDNLAIYEGWLAQEDVDILNPPAGTTLTYSKLAWLATSLFNLPNGKAKGSDRIDNSSLSAIDAVLGGKITTGGVAPTAEGLIEIYVVGSDDDVLFDDGYTGLVGEHLVTNNLVKRAHTLVVDTTTTKTYEFGGVRVAALFGERLPKYWGVIVINNTGSKLDDDPNNFRIHYRNVNYKNPS